MQLALEVAEQAEEVGEAVHLQAIHQGGLGGVHRGHEQPLVAVGAGDAGHRQHTVHVAQATVQRELTDEHGVGDVGKELLRAHQQGDGDGEVVRRPLFAQVSGG